MGAATGEGAVDGSAVGRYQIVVVGKEGAVLLDTATGSSWSLARDIDTLQLGWRPLGGHLPPSRAETDETLAAWRPRRGSRWSRNHADADPS